MSDLKSIRYSARGPEGTGLEPWDPIPPESLISGEPVQTGHVYLTDETGQLTSGVWHCTPMIAKPAPYDVNEFMMVLEGAITICHEDGSQETIRAGESFVVPKGTPLSWKQTDDVLKFWVIFEDASGEELDTSRKVVHRIDPASPLDPVGEQDTSRYVGGRTGSGDQDPLPGCHRADDHRGLADQRDAHQADAVSQERAHAHPGRRSDDHRRFGSCRNLPGRRHLHGAQGHDLPLGQLRHGPQDLLHLPGTAIRHPV